MKVCMYALALITAAFFCLGMVDTNIYTREVHTVTVKGGDTLDGIAARYYDRDERCNIFGNKTVAWAEFRSEVWNDNPDKMCIQPGDSIKVITYKKRM